MAESEFRLAGARPLARAHGQVRRTMAAAWRFTVRVSARDMTEQLARSSALVVAPHPDDEVFGCGALIARKIATGAVVDVAVVTDGTVRSRPAATPADGRRAAVRSRELEAAMATLGVTADHVHQLSYPDSEVSEHLPALARSLGEVIAATAPAEVFVPASRDPHPDHRAVNAAAHQARRDLGGVWPVYEYPIGTWLRGPWQESLRWPSGPANLARGIAWTFGGGRPLRVRTGPFRETKVRALTMYHSQIEPVPDTGRPVMSPSAVRLLTGRDEYLLPPRP